jgi:hypothetical protein
MSKGANITHLYSLELKDIYPGENNDFRFHLDGIGKDLLTKACIFLLSFKSYESEYADYQILFSRWFSDPSVSKDIIDRIDAFLVKKKLKISIINPYTSLQLLEYSFKELPEQSLVNDKEFELKFIKAYLSLNQETNSREKTISNSTKGVEKENRLPALILTQGFSYSDIANYDLYQVLIAQMMKAYLLLSFLATNHKTNKLLELFLGFYELSDWKEFIKFYLPLAFSFVGKEKEAHHEISITRNDKYDITCAFMDKLIVTGDDEFKYHDFVTLRSKPFKKSAEGLYLITFMLFAVEKLYQGMYFFLSSLNKSLPDNHKVANNNDFRSFYCDQFSEKYLLYSILDRCYPKKFTKYTGEEIKQKGIAAEPDYYVRFKNKLFLFESKDVLVRTDIKHSHDYRLIEKVLSDKFYYTDDKGKIENRAILQLINSIKEILCGNYSFDQINLEQVKIYPILVVHHRVFDTAGLNRLLLSWFNKELDKLSQENISFKNVRGIVVINIDLFILIQDYLQSRKIRLEEVIDDYLYYAELQRKKPFRTKRESELYVLESLKPFEYFMNNHVKKKGLQEPPRMLTEQSQSLFK